MALYIGLDSSTQSLSAVVIDLDLRKVVSDCSVNFAERLPQFGCENGAFPSDDTVVHHADPLMWVAALDLLFEDLGKGGFQFERVASIAGSGQQHGSVYLSAQATQALASLDRQRSLVEQLRPVLARKTAPIWRDSSTNAQCHQIEQALGGPAAVADLTGSRCYERFTGPQIRKFFQQDRRGYDQTDRIHLVSSFMASLLLGRHAPIDHGDGAGMNLMDIRTRTWAPAAVAATADGLQSKLPQLVPSDTVLGTIHQYFVAKYKFSPQTQVVAWSGDNPCTLIGLGFTTPDKVGISLGTSDTVFRFLPELRLLPDAEGHIFGSPTGHYMSLVCFKNASLAREDHVRDRYHLTWADFSDLLRNSKPGNDGRVMLPYFEPEITPQVLNAGVRRYGLDESDAPGNVRAVVEAQAAAMALHARWPGLETRTIYVTGGASVNREICQVIADMHNAEVRQTSVAKSAALGAALRAAHASLTSQGTPCSWDDLIADFVKPSNRAPQRPSNPIQTS
jgi:xylulokinase